MDLKREAPKLRGQRANRSMQADTPNIKRQCGDCP